MSDVVVIGGGVIGMMSARVLALRGARVTLIERGRLGAQSSWAGGGILSALIPWQTTEAISRLILWGHYHYPSLVEMLNSETDIDAQYYRSGMVVTTPVTDIDTAHAWAVEQGFQAETLSNEGVATLLPETKIIDETHAAIYLPEIAQIRNPRLIKALAQSLRNLGVLIQEGCEIKEIVTQGRRVAGVKTSAQTYAADHVVLAAGAWAARLMPELVQRQVQPIRGEMLLYKVAPNLLSSMIVAEGGYLIPRQDGHILCGSTVEEVGFDCSTTQNALSQLSARAECLLPSLKKASIVGHWAGLRPGSGDGVPVLSRHSEYDNLTVNCGHFRNGIAMAPASAQIVADLVEGVEPAIDGADYVLV
ncbi:MAG: glycine oxidase ThiO [Gammaproteobacteria bacterium]|nr:MAG: glycine oxidase ThiO [Gammaproteobacteria bacterium]